MEQPIAPPAVVFGQGPPVILLHPFPLDGRVWFDLARELSSGYQVIVPDLRGFGTAHHQLGNLQEISIDLLADDLELLLDERKLEAAVFGGISRGGYVALAFAGKYPARVRALMLLDTRANPADDKEKLTYRTLCDRLTAEGPSAAIDVMSTRLFAPATLSSQPELIAQVSAVILSQTAGAIAAGARGMVNRPDAQPLLAQIRVPTLAVAGEYDAAFENTRAIAQAIPHAQFVSVPAAGHLSILEQPEFVSSVIRQFLDALTQ